MCKYINLSRSQETRTPFLLWAGRNFSREHILSDNEDLQKSALSKEYLGFHEKWRGAFPTSLFPESWQLIHVSFPALQFWSYQKPLLWECFDCFKAFWSRNKAFGKYFHGSWWDEITQYFICSHVSSASLKELALLHNLCCQWLCFPYFPLFPHRKLQRGEICFAGRFTSLYNTMDSRKLSRCRGMLSTGQQFFHPLHKNLFWPDRSTFTPSPSMLFFVLLLPLFTHPWNSSSVLPLPGQALPAVPGSTSLGVSQP